jgi:hypothetical protein
MASNSLITALNPFKNKQDDVESFLTQFNLISDLEKWNEEKKIIMLKLSCKDQALKFLIGDPEAKNLTVFQDLEKVFRSKFKKTESFANIQSKFTKIKQGPKQSVRELGDEISELVGKFTKVTESQDPILKNLHEQMMLSKFIDALRPELQLEVKKTGPNSFKAAVATAINIENALEENPPINSEFDLQINTLLQQQLESQAIIHSLSEKIEELKSGQINNITATNVNNREFQKERVQCQICLRKNHKTSECFYFPTQRGNFRPHNSFRGRNQVSNRGYRGNLRNNFNRRGRASEFHPYRNNNRHTLN